MPRRLILSFQGWDSKATDAEQGPRAPTVEGGTASLFSCSHHPLSFTYLFSSLRSYGTQTYLGDFNCWEKWRKPVFYHCQAHSYVLLYILGESHRHIIFIYFWLCQVFIASCRLSLVAASSSSSSLQHTGFSWGWLL